MFQIKCLASIKVITLFRHIWFFFIVQLLIVEWEKGKATITPETGLCVYTANIRRSDAHNTGAESARHTWFMSHPADHEEQGDIPAAGV